MKKILLIALTVILIFGCIISGGIDNLFGGMIQDVSSAFNRAQKNVATKKSQRQRGMDEGMKTLQEIIDATKEQKAAEIKVIDDKIAANKKEIKGMFLRSDLTFSQKREETKRLEEENKTLEAEKEKIDEKYRQIIRSFRD